MSLTDQPLQQILAHPLAAAIGCAGLLAAVTGVLWWRRRRRLEAVEYRLQRCCNAMLADFVISDGNANEIQIEYALLTPGGVTVLDLKELEGHVFGSDNMEDWTVISDKRRFTFSNPQHALYDRIAAVRRIIPEVPVEGYVVFSESARFSKGQPGKVIMLEALLARLEKEHRAHGRSALDAFSGYWDRLRDEAVTARFESLLRN